MRHAIIRTLLFTILLTTSSSVLLAQDTDDLLIGGEEPGQMRDDMSGVAGLLPLQGLLSNEEDLVSESGTAPFPGDIPVDGGLSLLLAAGAAYGVRRVRRGVKR